VFIPPDRGVVTGTVAVDPGYSKPHTAADMREWADGLSRFYATFETDPQRVERLLATPRNQLTPEARAVVDAHRQFLTEPACGMTGSLRPDGTVEMDTGRHRAHYLIERGTDPLPVWVSSPDEQSLRRFRHACHSEVARTRPSIARSPERELGRLAVTAPEPERLPEIHIATERKERTRERGVWRPERDH
jgi:hypothetical protein